MAHSKLDIQATVDKLEKFTTWADLRFNNSKCAVLSAINSTGRKYVQSYSSVGREVQVLGSQHWQVPLQSLPALKKNIINDVEKICQSQLKPVTAY